MIKLKIMVKLFLFYFKFEILQCKKKGFFKEKIYFKMALDILHRNLSLFLVSKRDMAPCVFQKMPLKPRMAI